MENQENQEEESKIEILICNSVDTTFEYISKHFNPFNLENDVKYEELKILEHSFLPAILSSGTTLIEFKQEIEKIDVNEIRFFCPWWEKYGKIEKIYFKDQEEVKQFYIQYIEMNIYLSHFNIVAIYDEKFVSSSNFKISDEYKIVKATIEDYTWDENSSGKKKYLFINSINNNGIISFAYQKNLKKALTNWKKLLKPYIQEVFKLDSSSNRHIKNQLYQDSYENAINNISQEWKERILLLQENVEKILIEKIENNKKIPGNIKLFLGENGNKNDSKYPLYLIKIPLAHAKKDVKLSHIYKHTLDSSELFFGVFYHHKNFLFGIKEKEEKLVFSLLEENITNAHNQKQTFEKFFYSSLKKDIKKIKKEILNFDTILINQENRLEFLLKRHKTELIPKFQDTGVLEKLNINRLLKFTSSFSIEGMVLKKNIKDLKKKKLILSKKLIKLELKLEIK